MISFTLTDIGAQLLHRATTKEPLNISSISLYSGEGIECYSTNNFTGNIILDEAIGKNYILVELIDASENNYTCNSVVLKSESDIIAVSDSSLQYNKLADRSLHIRINAQFDGVEKCTFNKVSVGFPYATSQSAGLVSFSNFKEP